MRGWTGCLARSRLRRRCTWLCAVLFCFVLLLVLCVLQPATHAAAVVLGDALHPRGIRVGVVNMWSDAEQVLRELTFLRSLISSRAAEIGRAHV